MSLDSNSKCNAPILLTEYPNAHFMGQVRFRTERTLVTDGEAISDRNHRRPLETPA